MSWWGPWGYICPIDGPHAAQRQPPIGVFSWEWPQEAETTKLYQNVTLVDGQTTPQHSLGLQESVETIGQKLGELPASSSDS